MQVKIEIQIYIDCYLDQLQQDFFFSVVLCISGTLGIENKENFRSSHVSITN